MGSVLPIKIKSRTFKQKPELGSFRSSVVSAGSFCPESLWLIFVYFVLYLINLFLTLVKDLDGAMGVYFWLAAKAASLY